MNLDCDMILKGILAFVLGLVVAMMMKRSSTEGFCVNYDCSASGEKGKKTISTLKGSVCDCDKKDKDDNRNKPDGVCGQSSRAVNGTRQRIANTYEDTKRSLGKIYKQKALDTDANICFDVGQNKVVDYTR